MPTAPEYGPAKWDEPMLRGKWGLYAPAADRCLPVVFASEREANEMAHVLKRRRPRSL